MPTLMKEISSMTQDEKLAAMDMLWTSIMSTCNDVESPAWHKTILNERRRRAESGEESFIAWENAKHSLRAEFA